MILPPRLPDAACGGRTRRLEARWIFWRTGTSSSKICASARCASSASFSLTKEEIVAFAGRWDPHLWHVDEEAANNSFFGGIVASGLHSFAAFTNLLTRGFLLDVAVTAGRGINIQMTAPVRPDQEIHARVTVTDLQDVPHRPEQGLVVLYGENTGADGTVVMTVEIDVLVARRPADG